MTVVVVACSCFMYVELSSSYHLGLPTFTPGVDDISNIRNAMAEEKSCI